MDRDVTAYMERFDGEARQRLQTARDIVRRESPDAVESLSYGLIGYKRNGKPLVYVGGFASHTGFYATPKGHETFSQDFAPYKQGKGSVRFPYDQPLPTDLIARVVKYRNNQTEV